MAPFPFPKGEAKSPLLIPPKWGKAKGVGYNWFLALKGRHILAQGNALWENGNGKKIVRAIRFFIAKIKFRTEWNSPSEMIFF